MSGMKWWSDFLDARASAIAAMRSDGKGFFEIVKTLNLDIEQAVAIAASAKVAPDARSPGKYEACSCPGNGYSDPECNAWENGHRP